MIVAILIIICFILFCFLRVSRVEIKCLKSDLDEYRAFAKKQSDQLRLKGIEVDRLTRMNKKHIRTIEGSIGGSAQMAVVSEET